MPAAIPEASSAVPLLRATGASIRLGERRLIDALDLCVAAGQFVAVLGRNGSGKTLLLHTLAGLRPVDAGTVHLGGEQIEALDRREIARRLALLAQDAETAQSATVGETVMLARFAHLPLWGRPAATDRDAVTTALSDVSMQHAIARDMQTLSGGEQRRVAAALVLAQDTPLMLLDEPNNHLDPHHALALLELFAARARAGGAVIAALHDPSLAARFATHALLLHGEGRWEFGSVDAMLGSRQLSELYLTPMLELDAAGRRVFVAG